MIVFKLKRQYISTATILLLLMLSSIYLFNNLKNEKIEKTIFNIKALEQEGDTYRLVTSADNIQVPVPKGYVASNITGENYVSPKYSHTNISHKGNYTELTWSSPTGEQYPWTQDENGIWISGNQGIASSTSVLESEEFDYIKGTTLTIKYTYSCERYDYFLIDIISLTTNTTQNVISKSGNTNSSFNYNTSNYTFTMNDWGTGRYKIRVSYYKNPSVDGGQDSGYIKPSTYFKEDENGTETVQEDIKTRIHDGGFVIYQLTDEEVETDPNGTSIVINDTNKETEQRKRNQYVWVPVTNTNEIVIKTTENNGILQFGRNYSFGSTSIIDESNTVGSNFYKEPRVKDEYDKTKYYLQKFVNMNKRENFLNEMQEDFARMLESINKYKGFYIGRYETGDEVIHDYNYNYNNNNGAFIKPKIIRYNNNIDYTTWYDSYKDLERLSGKTGKYVETGMIHDCLWDHTLRWLNKTDTRSFRDLGYDSGKWGNYYNNTKIPGGVSTGLNYSTGEIETIIYNGEINNNFPTGSNNIFDLAGNAEEWTRAGFAYNNRYRCVDGGYSYLHSDSDTASRKSGNDPFSNMSGARAQLYIL